MFAPGWWTQRVSTSPCIWVGYAAFLHVIDASKANRLPPPKRIVNNHSLMVKSDQPDTVCHLTNGRCKVDIYVACIRGQWVGVSLCLLR